MMVVCRAIDFGTLENTAQFRFRLAIGLSAIKASRNIEWRI
jgi:hypothetical protein